jgi:hypothetical protein
MLNFLETDWTLEGSLDKCFIQEDDFSAEEFDPFNIRVQLYEAS